MLKKLLRWIEGDGNQEPYFAIGFLGGLGLMGAGWLGKWLGSQLFGGKEPERPEAPQMGPFQPYTMPIQPQLGSISQGLERQGQKATRGMYQQAASTGTFYGGQPGAVEIEAAKTEAMGQAELGLIQQQNTEKYKQYAIYQAQKYGMESREAMMAWDEYMKRLQGQQAGQQSLTSGLLGAAGSIGGMLPWGDWFGGGKGGESQGISPFLTP